MSGRTYCRRRQNVRTLAQVRRSHARHPNVVHVCMNILAAASYLRFESLNKSLSSKNNGSVLRGQYIMFQRRATAGKWSADDGYSEGLVRLVSEAEIVASAYEL